MSGERATLALRRPALIDRAKATRSRAHRSRRPARRCATASCSRPTRRFDPPTTPLDANGQGTPYAVYGFGAQIAELEVDIELGTVKLLKITAAHDVGRAINPTLVEGQIEGGIAQGLGLALMEEFFPGRTENLHDYLIPTIGDVPPIEIDPDRGCRRPSGPFGAKGIGEQALIPTAPAILNAIRHATGVRMTRCRRRRPRAGGDPRARRVHERARRAVRTA